jgi:hypothetical protein
LQAGAAVKPVNGVNAEALAGAEKIDDKKETVKTSSGSAGTNT